MSRATLVKMLFVVVLLFSCAALAQDITGTVAGTIKDSTGAVIPGATVLVTNLDTGVKARTVITDDASRYVVPFLPVGRYRINVDKAGFQKGLINSVQVNAHDEITGNLVLQIGSTTQEVTVVANAVSVELESSQAAGLIDEAQIREIPLNSRNYEQLVILQPGVSYGGGDQL